MEGRLCSLLHPRLMHGSRAHDALRPHYGPVSSPRVFDNNSKPQFTKELALKQFNSPSFRFPQLIMTVSLTELNYITQRRSFYANLSKILPIFVCFRGRNAESTRINTCLLRLQIVHTLPVIFPPHPSLCMRFPIAPYKTFYLYLCI